MIKPKRGTREWAVMHHDYAKKMLEKKIRELTRLSTSIRFWQRRADRYAQRAAMTAEEMALQLAQRKARRRKRRAIAVGGGI